VIFGAYYRYPHTADNTEHREPEAKTYQDFIFLFSTIVPEVMKDVH
jgi:hypothetical protein